MRRLSVLLRTAGRRRGALIRDDASLFRRARLQLTVWYALTLMVIVLGFSAVLYGVLSARLAGHHREAAELASARAVERDATNFALDELRVYLLIGNVTFLVLGLAGAYLLAGRTLRPIAETMSRQQRFAADASHELRTPLTVMRGNIDVALLRKRPAGEYRTVLREVGAEVDGMTVLIQQLLQLARGNAPPKFESVDVQTLIDEALRASMTLAAERGSTVQYQESEALVTSTDRLALKQIVANLVGNALQHTPSGTAVRLCTDAEDGGIAIRVIDNGPGIPATERANVFHPFYRLGTTGADGHGLGLALTYELVATVGGTIAIDETPGGGATLRVWIPQVAAEPAGIAREIPRASVRASHHDA
jgi:signal transduction histidine kinase